jgi:hypothetical protein
MRFFQPMASCSWRRARSGGGQQGSLVNGTLSRHSLRRLEMAEQRTGQQSVSSRDWRSASMCSVQAAEGAAAIQRRTCVESSGESQQGHLLSSWMRQICAVTPSPPLFSEPCLVHHRRLPAGRAFIRAPVASQSTKEAAAGSSLGVGWR